MSPCESDLELPDDDGVAEGLQVLSHNETEKSALPSGGRWVGFQDSAHVAASNFRVPASRRVIDVQ